MFKVRCNPAHSMSAQGIGGILAPTRRRDVMRFVHDQQVKLARVGWLATGRQHFAEEAQRSLAFEKIYRGDEPWEVRPGVDMQPTLTPQDLEQVAIDDAKFQSQLTAPPAPLLQLSHTP